VYVRMCIGIGLHMLNMSFCHMCGPVEGMGGSRYVPGWLHGLRHESWPRHDAADEATRLVLTKLELQMKHDMALSRRWTAPMFRAALKLAFRYYAAAMLATAAAVLVCCCGLVIANRVRSLLGAAGVGAVSDDGTTQ